MEPLIDIKAIQLTRLMRNDVRTLALMVLERGNELTVAHHTIRRLNYRAQRAESRLAKIDRAERSPKETTT